jgi:2-C-methyl-D-erythritol 4-phosphate cytidylyltransferase
MPKVAVILPAAGQSTRFGGPQKKPYVSLDGRSIWQRSAELFWTRDDVSRVYLVINPDDRDDFKQRFTHLIAFANAELVDGGAERFESVANALAKIPESVDLVAVHDAVRPLTPLPLVDEVFAAAAKTGAAMLAVPVADTLKRVDPKDNRITDTVPRQNLWQAQTPQVFRRDWLVEAYAKRSTFTTPITDDAQLIEALGHSVYVVTGSPTNFKITTKEDLDLADALLKGRAKKPAPAPAARFDDDAKW